MMGPMREERRSVTLVVNDETHHVVVEPRRTLADVLREELRLTGTHLGCEQGSCGACTVLVGGERIRSCLMLAVQADGQSVRTVEGLAEQDGSLHAFQQACLTTAAFQCGFCSPGILVAMAAMLDSSAHVDEAAIRTELSGHLCRCTGYSSIVQAALQVMERRQ